MTGLVGFLVDFLVGVFAAIVFPSLAFAETQHVAQDMFGVKLLIEYSQGPESAIVTSYLKSQAAILSTAWDPDCYYHNKNAKCESQDSLETKKIDTEAKRLKQETHGVFNVIATKGLKQYRDYGGLSQGLFIDILRQQYKTMVGRINFSGDIFISPEFLNKTIEIADPVIKGASLGHGTLANGGWLFYSGGKSVGVDLRGDKSGMADFAIVVVFGESHLPGVDLDAWATTIAVGGKKSLKDFLSHKKFATKVGVFTYENKLGHLSCHGNLSCQTDQQPIEISFPAKK